MFSVILAMTKNGGIGSQNKLPWHNKEEFEIFRKKTDGSILIVGRKTADGLPLLKNRDVYCISRTKNNNDFVCGATVWSNMDDALSFSATIDKKVFIAGGAQIYKEVFANRRNDIDRVHVSVMDDEFVCDSIVDFDWNEWTIESVNKYNGFTHYVLLPGSSGEGKYLSLLKDVMKNGVEKKGRNGTTKSVFGRTLSFDLTKGFPLLTTKKMFWRGIVEELLFFIRGDTDSKKLEDKKINIWRGNTNRMFLDSIGMTNRPVGVMGPMYGAQWRHFNAPYDENKAEFTENGLDQLVNVVDKINNDPGSRRILLTDFNPLQANDGVLYPCHSIIIQFYVVGEYLDMFCFNRSSDLFHGLPFNIASSALFLQLIAQITGKTARNFVLSLGDAHIYESHYGVVKEQLDRIPNKLPELNMIKVGSLGDIEKMMYKDFELVDYEYHKSIKADMVA